MTTRRRFATAFPLVVAILVLAAPARADEREAIEALREFLDPDREFLWQPRKRVLAAFETLGQDPLRNVALLRELAYQGRHFQPRFSDRKWQRMNGIAEFQTTSAIYRNLKSEESRFTYTVPKRYPKVRELERIPRVGPYPLLLTLPEVEDAGDHPGAACLARRHPRAGSTSLYDGWLTLAPVAPRARFLNDDGTLRHRFATFPLTDFWRRYHVDFDRIVVEGTEPAAAMCAMFPQIFAGLVLRGGEITHEVVRNYAGVPVFVVGSPTLEKALKEAGHPDVTGGTDRDVVAWLNRCRRTVPADFEWNMHLPEQMYPNWIAIDAPDLSAPGRTLSVQVLDTEAEPNTIQLASRGIGRVTIFLNDEVIDLDREVRVVHGDEELFRGTPERTLDQVFVREPDIRKNMNFGWLYPAVVADVVLDPDLVPPPADEPGPKPGLGELPSDGGARRAARLEAERLFLLGRPDLMDGVLFPLVDATGAGEAIDPELNLALALRDLWWRRTEKAKIRNWHKRAAARATGILADQYRWILGGGAGPYPHPADVENDPWPALTALVLDRQYREHTGHAHLPEVSPLQTFVPHPEWEEWFDDWRAYAAGSLMRDAYRGFDPSILPPDERSVEQEARDRAAAIGRRNGALALGLGTAFVALVFLATHRMGRSRRSGPPPRGK